VRYAFVSLLICAGFGAFLIGLNVGRKQCATKAVKSTFQAVTITKLKNGGYQMSVGGTPYVIKGVCYNPIPIGQGPEYDWWSDRYKPWLVDGKLMKELGINTVRIYQPGEKPENVSEVIRDLYKQFGIRVALGNWLGFWEYPCPLYGEKNFREKIRADVLKMVTLYKDEPGILCWILGNENNYSCLGTVNPWSTDEIENEPDQLKRRRMRSEIYYSFIKELTDEIHAIDPNHPVCLGNGELIGLEIAREKCPNVDIVACIIYRGKTFGPLFKSLAATFDKPVIISEFGADCFDAVTQKEDQNMQAFFLDAQWRQIYGNLGGVDGGEGNCLGGTMFEWTDEWWKHNPGDQASWMAHDMASNWSNGSYYFDINAQGNLNMNEEWFGIVAVSDTEKEGGLDKRMPRKAYYVIRDFWKNPYAAPRVKPPVARNEPREKIRGLKISGE
jgi:hypothetical protein